MLVVLVGWSYAATGAFSGALRFIWLRRQPWLASKMRPRPCSTVIVVISVDVIVVISVVVCIMTIVIVISVMPQSRLERRPAAVSRMPQTQAIPASTGTREDDERRVRCLQQMLAEQRALLHIGDAAEETSSDGTRRVSSSERSERFSAAASQRTLANASESSSDRSESSYSRSESSSEFAATVPIARSPGVPATPAASSCSPAAPPPCWSGRWSSR